MDLRRDIENALFMHFKSHIIKHQMNIQVMLENPRAIPEHTDIMDAIEKELALIDEYDGKLQMLQQYIVPK
jgi:hypothetical protein